MKILKRALIPLLVIVGIFLVSYQYVINNFIAPVQLENTYTETMAGVTENDMKTNLETNRENGGEFNFGEVEMISNMEVNPYINKENVIGGIYIPSVGVNMPIMYGATNENLAAAVGTMKPEQEMGEGNYALAGHNAKNPDILFAPIRRIIEGDLMYITDKERVYVYEMVRSDIVMPDKVEVIDDVEGSKLLTLVSCYSEDGSDRIIVKGQLVGVIEFTEAEEDIQNAFKG